MKNYSVGEIPSITQTVMNAIGIATGVGIVYDIIAYCTGGNDATLSKAMQTIGFNWPIVIVAYGGLGAHFFCPRTTEWMGWWIECKPYLLLALGMLVFRIAWPQMQTS